MRPTTVAWAVLALTACCLARTTTKQQQPISAHITSLTDKDARSKAMVHPAFANAGRQAGVEIWRIEDFEPVAVPQSDFGKFYKGDSYIILKTTADKKNNLSWDIHYWLGASTSQDESGAAAILTVGLDDKFNGAAVQHRETQGHESAQFTSYFQPAIRYLDGGHASGFSHVTTNAGAEKRLFQIKGKRNVRVRQVDPSVSSMNKGDCFILDVNHDIYVYVGDKAKNVERLKAISVANQIRDQDHNGRGRVEIIDQYSSEVDVDKFFTALGSGSRSVVPEDTAGGDDQAFERSEEQTVTLSEISDSSGKIKVTPLTKPYRQEQLKPQECYILDTVSGSIYVWVGKQATDREKSEAMSKAEQYLSSKNYPSWVHVSRIPQGTEPAAFKQYFATWRDVGMTHTRVVRSPRDDNNEMTGKNGEENSRIRMYKVTGSTYDELEAVEVPAVPSSLHSEDVFIVETPGELILWHGKLTSETKRATGLEAIKKLYAERVHSRQVVETREDDAFWNNLGGRPQLVKQQLPVDNHLTPEPRLFEVDIQTDNTFKFYEKEGFTQENLDTNNVYVLEAENALFVWIGKDASLQLKKSALQIASAFTALRNAPDAHVEIIKQGLEPESFVKHFEEWDPEMWMKQKNRENDDTDLNEV